MPGYLIEEIKVTPAITITAGAAGATTVNGAVLDMAGWDGVLIVVTTGAIVALAVTSIKAQQDTAVGFGAPADLTGTNQAIADTDDDKVYFIDIQRPLEQFVRVVVSRATANATVSAVYIQYRNRNKPTAAQGATVAGEKFVSPVEGVA